MREQYQSEMLKICVPKSLLERTKQAMKEEEQKIRNKEQKKKVLFFGKAFMAAAAAVLLLVVTPVAANYLNTDSQEQSGQLYLAGKEEAEMVEIEADREKGGLPVWFEELLEKIEELFN